MTRAVILPLALLVLIVTVTIAGCGGGCTNCGIIAVPARQDISAAQLQAMLDGGQPVQLVDVRTAAEFADGVLPGAINIPVDYIKGPTEDLAALRRNVRTVVYCASGNRSVTASAALLEMGFRNVFNLLGGINAWSGALELPDCGCG